MNKKIIIITIIFSLTFSYANDFNQKVYNTLIQKLEIKNDKVNHLEEFTEILLPIQRSERKEICLKVLNTYKDTNPKVAYTAANCLLYNGYGDLAIPLFTRYLYNGYNEKYFNKRIGYGWLHNTNWYKVDDKILTNMLEGLDFYTWVTKKIDLEVLAHPKTYGEKALSSILKHKLKKVLTKEEKRLFEECLTPVIHIDKYQCNFNKKLKKLEHCHEKDNHSTSWLTCKDFEKK